jgi:hypothetical protein
MSRAIVNFESGHFGVSVCDSFAESLDSGFRDGERDGGMVEESGRHEEKS